MQIKKIVPLALVAVMTAAASAGAADVQVAKINISNSITSQARQQLVQKLMEKFDFSACLPDWDIPLLKPETKPEQTPYETPEEIPEEMPEETPDEQPDETPDNTPDEKPDEQPDDAVKARVEEVLEERGWQVDVVFSHTCPICYEPTEMFLPSIDQRSVDKTTEMWLGALEYRLQYQNWYCGHYHTSKTAGRLRFLFEEILPLEPEGPPA